MLVPICVQPICIIFLIRRIVHVEFLCFVHVDEICLKLYPWNIVHLTSPCKYILIYLLFYNCLLMEGSQYLTSYC